MWRLSVKRHQHGQVFIPVHAMLIEKIEEGEIGCWGPNSFDNDEALDWLAPLSRAQNKSDFIREALEDVIKSDYFEQDVCERAIAAAEFVASARGRRPANVKFSEEIEKAFRLSDFLPSEELSELATKAVLMILNATKD